MAEAKGIEALKQMLDVIEIIAVDVKKIAKDKELTLGDLPYVLDLIQKLDQIIKVVKAAGEIPAEAKDLSISEAQEVLAKLYSVAKAVQAA